MGNDAEGDDNCKPVAEPMGEDVGGKEGGKGTGTKPELKNVYLASRDEESVLQISRGRDNSVFEGDDNGLGQGKNRATLTDGAKDADANAGGNGSLVDGIETTLTDGAKNPTGNAGANNRSVKGIDEIVDKMEMTLTDDYAMSTGDNEGAEEGPVNNIDEIGLIFDIEGINKTVCLKEFGSYVKFNNKCLHRGYKRGSIKKYLSAQLFSAP